MLLMASLPELGRMMIRSVPILATWSVMRRLIPPASERMRTMEATPMAMPRAVRKERVRLRRRLLLASWR